MIYLTWPLSMGISVASDCSLLKTNLHAHFGAFILSPLGKQSWEAMCWCQILKTHLSHLNLSTSLPDVTGEEAETERFGPRAPAHPASGRAKTKAVGIDCILGSKSGCPPHPDPVSLLICGPLPETLGIALPLTLANETNASRIGKSICMFLLLPQTLFCHESKPRLLRRRVDKHMKHPTQGHPRPASPIPTAS